MGRGSDHKHRRICRGLIWRPCWRRLRVPGMSITNMKHGLRQGFRVGRVRHRRAARKNLLEKSHLKLLTDTRTAGRSDGFTLSLRIPRNIERLSQSFVPPIHDGVTTCCYEVCERMQRSERTNGTDAQISNPHTIFPQAFLSRFSVFAALVTILHWQTLLLGIDTILLLHLRESPNNIYKMHFCRTVIYLHEVKPCSAALGRGGEAARSPEDLRTGRYLIRGDGKYGQEIQREEEEKAHKGSAV